MKLIAVVVLLCIFTACEPSSLEDGKVTSPSPSTNEVATISKELFQQLKAENDALRKENQMLRRELVTKNKRLPDSLLPEKAVAPRMEEETPAEDTGYWISTKSKIRHNRTCRNYRKVKGRPCGPNDGRPCQKCGG